jgi:hypothetical protein
MRPIKAAALFLLLACSLCAIDSNKATLALENPVVSYGTPAAGQTPVAWSGTVVNSSKVLLRGVVDVELCGENEVVLVELRGEPFAVAAWQRVDAKGTSHVPDALLARVKGCKLKVRVVTN